jgi:protein ImuB
MRTCVRMIVCVYLPRFELVAAAADGMGGSRALLGRALAIAPQIGCEQRVGEVSGAAEACGVMPGTMLGEALARCPELVLVPPDPVAVAQAWEAVLGSLEAIGAAVEPGRPGLAWFAADGLRGLHGGDAATIAAAQRAGRYPSGGGRARIGAGPTRFCALAAALAVRSRRPVVIDAKEARRWLAGRPVGLLGFRQETEALVAPLGRLGVRTLGELQRLGRAALADRFGAAGVLAHRLACGEDTSLRARGVEECLRETMSVGDASSGPALERVLGVLVDRLLARPERRGRALRAVTLSARLISGGAWSERAVFRQALSDPERIGLALSARLRLLPAPAAALGLTVECFGPPAGEQSALFDGDPARPAGRAMRLREAVGQARAAAGRDAVLRAVCVDPDSRVPERRVLLAPIPE